MTPDEAKQAVADQSRVRLYSASPEIPWPHAEGRIVSYSLVPTVTIELDNGDRVSWRHDLAEVVTEAREATSNSLAVSPEGEGLGNGSERRKSAQSVREGESA